jgi:hypothetical protein
MEIPDETSRCRMKAHYGTTSRVRQPPAAPKRHARQPANGPRQRPNETKGGPRAERAVPLHDSCGSARHPPGGSDLRLRPLILQRHAREVLSEALSGRPDEFKNRILAETLTPGIRVYAACFCEKGDLLSQWRGYTDTADGYAIGVPIGALDVGIPDRIATKAFYDRKEQVDFLHAAIRDYDLLRSPLRARPELTDLHSSLIICLLIAMLHFKDEAFREELEWRVITWAEPGNMLQARKPKYRPVRGNVVPYLELTFKPAAITTVILAPRCRDSNVTHVEQLLRDCHNTKADVRKSKIHRG